MRALAYAHSLTANSLTAHSLTANSLSADSAGPNPTNFDYGSETLWIILLKTIVLFAFLMVVAMIMVWWERRLISFMQYRLGPNRHGPFGLMQALVDGLKITFKEEIIPTLADKPVYWIAPVLSAVPAFVTFAVIPFGPVVSIAGHHTPLQLTDFGVAVLLSLACSSMGVYGVVLAGWASHSTYPLLGGLRAAAQMVSYEIAMGLALASVFVLAGSLSPSVIVSQQHDLWYAIALLPSLIIYMIAGVAEINRVPFDLAEGEGEIVGGYHTEYSSMKFVLFYISEYLNMTAVAALVVTLFFGGWRSPWPISIWSGSNSGWFPLIWFLIKLAIAMSVFVWIRATLPRLRYDQLMALGWKVMVPAALAWLLLVSTLQGLRAANKSNITVALSIGIPVMVLIGIWWIWDEKHARDIAARDEARTEAAVTAGSFPTPPMDLVVPPSPRLAVTAATPAGGAATEPNPEGDGPADSPGDAPHV
ncbi:MAG: NADH-quinone oxidoreductase subunit NuoH [Mycobacteriales bacterium]